MNMPGSGHISEEGGEANQLSLAEKQERAAGLIGVGNHALWDTLASIELLDEAQTQLLLSTLPPASQDLLETAEVITVIDNRVWLTATGSLVVEQAYQTAEAEDPDGTQRRARADEARQRVLDWVAQARAARL